MLKRMILINSANFQFADIDLSKEIFFVGDNASGKTTTTRALHFLYNNDGQKLGIPRTKDSFVKHYFPKDDSYIIYVFESFFIFTYTRNHTVKRWFSKQEFNYEKVIKDGELVEFKEIERYIKSASLKVKPQTIDEYTAILYGNNKKYIDFSIAKIENYKIFLEIFNMIFNIDKAIVTASDIKKAIQKSLDRKDEMLSIDYEDFIRKLNGFSMAYYFFKVFDSNRVNLKNALDIKDELFLLENDLSLKQKAINYRYSFEVNELNRQKENINLVNTKILKYKNKSKNIENLNEGFKNRVFKKINKLSLDIEKLKELQEKFNPLDIEENISIANKYNGIQKELDDKKISLASLKEKQSSAQTEIQNQISQIEHKIKVIIPNEVKESIYNLSELEKSKYDSEVLEIDNEYELSSDKIKKDIRLCEDKIEELKKNRNGINSKILSEQNEAKVSFQKEFQSIESNKKEFINIVDENLIKIKKLKTKKYDLDEDYQKHLKKYKTLRKTNVKILAEKRVDFNNQIANARTILNPIKNSFNEFLSNEIDGWESEIYPIIDKDLLKKSCDELKPEMIDAKSPLGFKIDISTLDKIPTKDEAIETIKQVRYKKSELLKNSKAVYKVEVSKLDEIKNELLAEVESCKKEIENLIDENAIYDAKIEKINNLLIEKEATYELQLKTIEDKYVQIIDELVEKISKQELKIKTYKDKIKTLEKDKRVEISKAKERRDFNLDAIKNKEIKKANNNIKTQKEIIEKLLKDMQSLDKDGLIANLEKEIYLLTTKLNQAYDAKKFLMEYEDKKDEIKRLPILEHNHTKYKKIYEDRIKFVKKLFQTVNLSISKLYDEKLELENQLKKYDKGIKKIESQDIEISEEKLEIEEFLIDIIESYEDIKREYANKKIKFRELIDKLKKLEQHSLIELNFNTENFSEVKSILELENIIDSLKELKDFENNKYESEKKRSHNNFNSFLKNTIPNKLQSFEDLENEFEKAKTSINRSLSKADFGVIRDIKLTTDSSKNRNDSISSLLKVLSKKVNDTIGLYSNKSLFYFDVSKSVKNIQEIQSILEEIKKKGSNGAINLFDTIDLSMSYIENGKKVDNKLNIKDESSSGGNILLKVAIAMSILNRFARKTSSETPFFLIIDEVSKLQSKNQDLIRKYINDNGFKTLFITPDPAYPDPKRAIYYTFKNIQEEGETLEIRQMNIV